MQYYTADYNSARIKSVWFGHFSTPECNMSIRGNILFKEEKIMKKTNTTTANTNTTTMPNTLNINGVTIQLTDEQVAKLAASLMFTATTPASVAVKSDEVKAEVEVAKPRKKSVKKAATVSEVESAQIKNDVVKTAEPISATNDNKLTDFADFEVQIDGNKLSFTAPEGKFLAYKTARYALNNRLKAICKKHAFNCVYNDKVWAWELRTMLGKPLSKTKMATIKAAVEAPVTVAELEDVRDRWSKKSSR